MNDQPESTRRNFIKSTAVAGALAAPGILRGDKKESTLRVGLVGCGGRGTGAASQAMKADPNVRLVAMGDLFQDRIDRSWESLKGRGKERFDVKPENKFLGF
ncbi:MAG: twin-arginine translocation signal domain-containing protein, partial [Opitutae bacterium]